MKNKVGLLSILLFILNFNLSGQIEISLKDKEDDTPIPYAVIYQPDTKVQFVTNKQGIAKVDLVHSAETDSIFVVVSHLNYRRDTFALKSCSEAKALYLEKKNIQLDEVKVTPLNINQYLKESYAKTNVTLDIFSIAKATYHQEFSKSDRIQSLFLGAAYYVHSGDIKLDKYSRKKDVLLLNGTEKYEDERRQNDELENKVWSYLYWELMYQFFSDEGYANIFSEEVERELSPSGSLMERVFVFKPITKEYLFDSLFLTIDRYSNLIKKIEVINFISKKPFKDKFELKWQEELIYSNTEMIFYDSDGKISLASASMNSQFLDGLKFSSGFSIHSIPLDFEFDRKSQQKWPKILNSLSAQEINPFLKKGIKTSDMTYFEHLDIPGYLNKSDAAYYRSVEGLSTEGREIDKYVEALITSISSAIEEAD